MRRRSLLMGLLGWFGSLFAGRQEALAQAGAAGPAFDPRAFPYPLVTVRGADALATLEALIAKGQGTPVALGGDEDISRLAEPLASPADFLTKTPAESLKAAEVLVWPSAIQERQRAEREQLIAFVRSPDFKVADQATQSMRAPTAAEREAEEKALRQEVDQEPDAGEWPASVGGPSTGLSVAQDIGSGAFLERVHIAILPTREAAEAPAYLAWGGWNDCPEASYHVAALRSWKTRYGARLMGASGDVLNIRVERRPQSRDEALALAREMYAYCPDIVDQGVGNLASLAAILMADDWWYFWWD